MGGHVHKIWMSTGLYDPEYPPNRIYQTINYWQSVRHDPKSTMRNCLRSCPFATFPSPQAMLLLLHGLA